MLPWCDKSDICRRKVTARESHAYRRVLEAEVDAQMLRNVTCGSVRETHVSPVDLLEEASPILALLDPDLPLYPAARGRVFSSGYNCAAQRVHTTLTVLCTRDELFKPGDAAR